MGGRVAASWAGSGRTIKVRGVSIALAAAEECPGWHLDSHIAPMVEAAGGAGGSFIDVCGWDGALCAALLACGPGAHGVCNSFLAPSIRSARQNLGAGWTVREAFGASRDQAGEYDVALIRAPYWLGNQAVGALIRSAVTVLRAGGVAFLSGERDRGVRTFAGQLKSEFGDCQQLMARGHAQVFRAIRGPDRGTGGPVWVPDFGEFEAEIEGRRIRLARHPAVFSDGRLDPATRLLIGTLPKIAGRQLDLGCGSGAVAVTMALDSPGSEIWAVDSNLMAVDVCRRTAELNGLRNVRVEAAEYGKGLPEGSFDVVACYPPFHVGPKVAHGPARRLIEAASRLLAPGGVFLIVQARAQSYEDELSRSFSKHEIAVGGINHSVFRCWGPRPAQLGTRPSELTNGPGRESGPRRRRRRSARTQPDSG